MVKVYMQVNLRQGALILACLSIESPGGKFLYAYEDGIDERRVKFWGYPPPWKIQLEI